MTKEPTSFAVTTKAVNVAGALSMRGAMSKPTPSIREKFEKSFHDWLFGIYGPINDGQIAEWAFLEGMRVAREIVKENKSISLAIKEFTDDHPEFIKDFDKRFHLRCVQDL